MAQDKKTADVSIYDLIREWFDFCFENPDLINPNHGAMYFFIIEHNNRLGWKKKFGLPMQMTMDAIGIKNYRTFSKTFHDLIEWGFIVLYQKSKNQYSANVIGLVKNTKAMSKAMSKAIQKHSQKQVHGIVGIDIPITNIPITNNIELHSISLQENAEREKIFEIFLFEKGIINPEKEVERFYAHYEKTGWVDANGNKIVKKSAAAINWKVKDFAQNNAGFLIKWQSIYKSISRFPESKHMIYGLKEVKTIGKSMAITATKELFDVFETAEGELNEITVASFKTNFPGYKIEWIIKI